MSHQDLNFEVSVSGICGVDGEINRERCWDAFVGHAGTSDLHFFWFSGRKYFHVVRAAKQIFCIFKSLKFGKSK